ncbi:hypothetical protein MF6394_25705 [Pseudomonas sp. MF6394]|nr:hypothetical protein MF6394_25705 [Pseudomonas sp. MF6394]
MLAKSVNDNACFLSGRGVFEFLASKLAPTKIGACPDGGGSVTPSHIWIACIEPEHQAQQLPAANSLSIGQSGR